ncbi:UNVERIFIED_CONTAM: Telokin [Trichonephila clavipes]
MNKPTSKLYISKILVFFLVKFIFFGYFLYVQKPTLSSIYFIYFASESRTASELVPPQFVQDPADSIVTEGNKHQFECQVFGNPLPLVSWFKDDVCIDYSIDYSITYNNGYCTLRIEEAIPDHQGRYTCRAVNQVGQAACGANLEVQSKSSFHYFLFISDIRLLFVRVLETYAMYNLLLRAIDGAYISLCLVINGYLIYGVFIAAITPSERPRFISPLSNVMARAGQKLRLECSVTGQPQPEISWLHNSKTLKEIRDTKVRFSIKVYAFKTS